MTKFNTLFARLSLCVVGPGLLLFAGCGDSVQMEEPAAAPAPQQAAAPQPQAKPKPAAPKKDPGSIIGKTTGEVLNLKEAIKNPDYEVVENKITGSDPFTQSASAYISLTSKASTLGMQQAIKTHKALNDRYPTYDEFMKIMHDHHVTFSMLPPYQMYGYDEDAGGIVILQDNKKKAEINAKKP